jgi:Nucleoside transporter
VNFIAAHWEDPQVYRDAFCLGENVTHSQIDHEESMLQTGRWLSLEQPSCAPYDKVDGAVFLYFLLGCVLLVACLIGYSFIGQLKQAECSDEYDTIQNVENANLQEASPRIGLELNTTSKTERDGGGRYREQSLLQSTATNTLYNDPLSTANEPDSIFRVDPANETAAVLKHVQGPAVCIFLTFFVTLGLFPGLTSELQSAHQCKSRFRLSNDLYIPFGFLLFNVGDLTGRLLLARVPLPRINENISTKLVVGSCLRFVFFPILFLCNGSSSHSSGWPTIHSDMYAVLAQFIFAVSNGFFLSAAFVAAPTLVPHATDMQERMSEILSFAVSFGLLCGSLFSFPILKSFG